MKKTPIPQTLKNYARQVEQKLAQNKDAIVFSATVEPIAYLECSLPMVFWADATFAGIVNFYPQYSNLHSDVVQDWHQMEKSALERCRLAIYSSDWAAQSAIENYGAEPEKVKVVPFGANIDSELDSGLVKEAISAKKADVCKLLFLGVEWHRKGGNIAYQVTKLLNQAGINAELTIVGCQPEVEEPLPEFVKILGFISKSTAEGKQKLRQLILESHFLILPSLADCTPMVFAEANSLGVPCLGTKIGGIPSIIQDDENGKLFALGDAPGKYCTYIQELFTNYSRYQKLAYSSYQAYESRLNWRVAGSKVKSFLAEII